MISKETFMGGAEANVGTALVLNSKRVQIVDDSGIGPVYSLNFGGTDEYGGRDQKIVSAFPFTMACRIKHTTTTNQTFFDITRLGIANTNYFLGTNLTNGIPGKPGLGARCAGTLYQANSSEAINDGGWHNLIGIFRSDVDRELFVDGVSKATSIDSVAFDALVDRYNFARNGDSTPAAYYTGGLRDLRCWDIDILAAGIAAYELDDYEPIEVGNTVLWLPMTEGVGSNVADYSGNGWDATLYNMEDGDWELFDNRYLNIQLPDARLLKKGGPHFFILNKSDFTGIEVTDGATGVLENCLHGEAIQLWLIDNTTQAGVWVHKVSTIGS